MDAEYRSAVALSNPKYQQLIEEESTLLESIKTAEAIYEAYKAKNYILQQVLKQQN